jgi:hypothetical protein
MTLRFHVKHQRGKIVAQKINGYLATATKQFFESHFRRLRSKPRSAWGQ